MPPILIFPGSLGISGQALPPALPAPDPDYELISELRKAGVEKVIAEGRINDGYKMKKCLDAGAFAVVIGTSITEPKKIVKTILNNCNERR